MRLVLVIFAFVLAAPSGSASTLVLLADPETPRLTLADRQPTAVFPSISDAGTKSWRQVRTIPPPPSSDTQALKIWLALCFGVIAAAVSPSARSALAPIRRRLTFQARGPLVVSQS